MNRTIVATQENIVAPASTRPLPPQEAGNTKHDPMRRFISTPHQRSLPVMGRAIRLETNASELLTHMTDLFAGYSDVSCGPPEFIWRIVVESDLPCSPPWPWRSTFSDEGIRFAQFGQRNFLAVDIDAREAVCFVSQGLFEDAHGFTSPFIDTLFYMSAAPLGLTPFASACVNWGNNGLLVLGEPNQGKTTASYLATQDGLTTHSDQSVFLELVDGQLRAWGDFVPLAFRAEAVEFLPELKSKTHLFSYCDFNFYYLPKPRYGSKSRPFVTPTCCLILERDASCGPRLELIESSDLTNCFSKYVAFKDDTRFDDQNRNVLAELQRLPAYRLAYGSDPAEAAPFFRLLLKRHGACTQSARQT